MPATETDISTEVLTIDEAAAILRISRNAAYAAARQWRATGGEHGLPCIELGRTLRVPLADLNRLLGHAVSSALEREPVQAIPYPSRQLDKAERLDDVGVTQQICEHMFASIVRRIRGTEV